MTRESILVIGGTGFIGRYLVDLLTAEGHDVTVAARRRPLCIAANTRFVKADLEDPASLRQAMAGISIVYHLATPAGSADLVTQYVNGTRAVAESCLEHNVRRLIFVSSIAALYLGARGSIDDTIPPDAKPHRRSAYAQAKIEAERLLREMHTNRSLPVVTVRPGVVVGRGSAVTHSGVGQWPSDICCVGWGRGTTPLPLVLVSDVAQALGAAKDAPGIEGHAFNLVADGGSSAREYVAALAEHTGRNFRFYPRTIAALQAIDIGKWFIKRAAGRAAPFPSLRDLKSRSLRTRFDCRGAREHLRWRPTDGLGPVQART